MQANEKTENMENLTTVKQIQESNYSNRTALYVDVVRKITKESEVLLENNPKVLFIYKMQNEIITYSSATHSADCEYMAYVSANHAEGWLNRMKTAIENN